MLVQSLALLVLTTVMNANTTTTMLNQWGEPSYQISQARVEFLLDPLKRQADECVMGEIHKNPASPVATGQELSELIVTAATGICRQDFKVMLESAARLVDSRYADRYLEDYLIAISSQVEREILKTGN